MCTSFPVSYTHLDVYKRQINATSSAERGSSKGNSFTIGFKVALIRPYAYGGVELTTPIEEWNSQLSFELGLGSELKVFGLYPIEAGVGYRVWGESDSFWIFKIKGGSF